MKKILLFAFLLIAGGIYAQNDSILPNVYAEYVVQDTYVNPDVNIWSHEIRYGTHDIFTGEETGEDTIIVSAYDFTLFVPIAYIALDGYRAYIKRYPDTGYEHFNNYFGDDWELLYDFSLNVGDTAGTFYDWDPDAPSTPSLIVLQVDTMYVQGEPRKVFKLGSPPNSVVDTWIQGMGSTMHPIAPKLRYFEVQRKVCGAAMTYGGPSPVDTNYYSVPNCSITSVRDNDPTDPVRIFPNPAQDYITVAIGDVRAADLVIHDPTGRKIHQTSLNSMETRIPTAGFPSGLYFLTIRYGTTRTARKILVR